jgi:hypothetical protein
MSGSLVLGLGARGSHVACRDRIVRERGVGR